MFLLNDLVQQKRNNSDYQSNLADWQSKKSTWDAEYAKYQKELNEWKSKNPSNSNGVSSSEISQGLHYVSEPNAKISISSQYKVSPNGNDQYWIEGFKFNQSGVIATVTYTNLTNSTYLDSLGIKHKIGKVVYTYSNPEATGNLISKMHNAISVYTDPIKNLVYSGTGITQKIEFYDETGNIIDFANTSSYLNPMSLNSWTAKYWNDSGIFGGVISEGVEVVNGGQSYALLGSSDSLHSNGKIYSDNDNSYKSEGSLYKIKDWDYDGSPYQYYGAALVKLTGTSLTLHWFYNFQNDDAYKAYFGTDSTGKYNPSAVKDINKMSAWAEVTTVIPQTPGPTPPSVPNPGPKPTRTTTSVNYNFTTTVKPCKIALIFEKEAIYMQKITSDSKFVDYYRYWVELYKVGSVRQVTLDGYWLVLQHLQQLIPNLQLKDLNHRTYQALINNFAQTHERKTVKGFHTHLKAALVDGLDEGLIAHDPTRHLVLKGKDPKPKKIKYLSMLELKLLIHEFDLNEQEINFDWLLFLISKTGLRIAEAIGITRQDFDFTNGTLSINKTWNYRSPQGGFQPTKNKSSNRVIAIDPILTKQFEQLTKHMENTQPIFVPAGKRFYVSSINNRLQRHCKNAGVPVISVHGLRHTHASLLMYDGVSIPSVAQRLGHASTLTTQSTYLHIVKELESLDNHKIMENMIRLS